MPDIRFPVSLAGDVPVVGTPAEIDITNADGLRAAMLDAAQLHQVTVVDMSQTLFCDSMGLHALIGARKRAHGQHGDVVIVATGTAVLRLLAISGLDRLIPHFATLEDALAFAADWLADKADP